MSDSTGSKTFSQKMSSGTYREQLEAMRDDLSERIEALPKDKPVANLYSQLISVTTQLSVLEPSEEKDSFLDHLAR